MKIKHLLVQLIILFFAITSFSQVVKSYQNSNYYGAIYSESANMRNVIDLSTVKGSPYENEIFKPGRIISELEKIPQTYLIRYNVYNDIIELNKYELRKRRTSWDITLLEKDTIN